MTTNNEETAITTTTGPRPATLATRGVVQLSTLDDVARLAKIAADSGLARVRTPAECAVILMTGAELGLSPMQSLRGIYVVEGRPTLAADTMVAVIRRSGVCALWRTIESTAETCTIEAKRNDDERAQSKTWTMADATRAGLAQKSIWKQYPAQMLRHRCAADLARELFSDVVLGLYDPEELDDATPEAQPAVVRREMPATTAQEPPQRPGPTLDGLGIETPTSRPQNAAETPAQSVNPVPTQEPPAWRVALDALHESAPDLAAYCNAVEALTLPGDAAPVWRSHRAAIGAMSKETKGSAWGALVARVESLGQRNAAAWITKGVKTLDAQTDAPAATEVTP